jgi:hypothetical protein
MTWNKREQLERNTPHPHEIFDGPYEMAICSGFPTMYWEWARLPYRKKKVKRWMIEMIERNEMERKKRMKEKRKIKIS